MIMKSQCFVNIFIFIEILIGEKVKKINQTNQQAKKGRREEKEELCIKNLDTCRN